MRRGKTVKKRVAVLDLESNLGRNDEAYQDVPPLVPRGKPAASPATSSQPAGAPHCPVALDGTVIASDARDERVGPEGLNAVRGSVAED